MTKLLSPKNLTTAFGLTQEEISNGQLDRLRRVQIAGAQHGRAGYYPDDDFSSDADWCYGIGAEINALETSLGIDDDSVMDLYREAHSTFFRDGTINPGERDWLPDVYEVCFGAAMLTTPHAVRVHAKGADQALETAAEYAYERWPGLFESADDMAEHYDAAAREIGVDLSKYTHGLHTLYDNGEDELAERIQNRAECDLTILDGGRYIRSDNWTIDGPL